MITFWVPPGSFEADEYLRGRGSPIADRITVRRYQWDRECLEIPGGAQIFAALDQLTDPERQGVGEIQRQLARQVPGIVMLNDPAHSLQRRGLLETLADRGINRFRAYPADQVGSLTRFPVFVRGERDHGGSQTGLLHSQAEVHRALRALRLRGQRLAELLIVEFLDTSDTQGVFRKYAAFRVGDAIVPAHLLQGRQWMIKSGGSDRTRAPLEEDLAFVERHPHEAQLRELFTLAGVGYGRMDYGMLGDSLQVWEINLNPTLGRRAGAAAPQLDPALTGLREKARALAHAKLREAFVALDRDASPSLVTVQLDPALRRAVEQAARKRRRRQRFLGLISQSYDSPLAAPLRALFPRAFPRQ